MELRLEMDGQPVVLHLKKNDHVTADTPVYTSEGKVVKLWDKTSKPVSIIITNFRMLRHVQQAVF